MSGDKLPNGARGSRVQRKVHPPQAGYTPADDLLCWICGSRKVVHVHCKITCRRCGFTRDCSDP